MQYYFFHKPNNQRLSVDSCARWKQKCEFYQELFNNYFTCHTLFFLQATSLCVQGQKLLNYYHNFYAKSCLAVAQEIFNEYSIVAFIPLNEVTNLTDSFYTNICTACIVFLALYMCCCLINLYFFLILDFCNVSKTFYTFEKLLDSIKIALKVA